MEAPESKMIPANRGSKSPWLAWFGILLVISGTALAVVFFVHASRSAENNTQGDLLAIICLVQALTGVILVTHTRRTPPGVTR